MTEDELLDGLTAALTLGGWRWFHIRRSDAALVMGDQGFPDIFAVHPGRGEIIAWELKSDTGRLSADQVAWFRAFLGIDGVDARIVVPADYDALLRRVLGTTAEVRA